MAETKALRVFRENESWLPDLEVASGSRVDRLGGFFRRGAFEPIVGRKVFERL